MAKAELTVTLKDFDKVKELFAAASTALPNVIEVNAQHRLALALTAFSANDDGGWERRPNGPDVVNLEIGDIWTSIGGYQWRRTPDDGWEVKAPS